MAEEHPPSPMRGDDSFPFGRLRVKPAMTAKAVLCVLWSHFGLSLACYIFFILLYSGDELLANGYIVLQIEVVIDSTEGQRLHLFQQGQPIPFKKVTLILFQDDNKPGQYYTDESFEEDDDPTVFYVEIKE